MTSCGRLAHFKLLIFQFLKALASNAKPLARPMMSPRLGRIVNEIDEVGLVASEREQLERNLFVMSEAVGQLPTELRIPPRMVIFNEPVIACRSIYDMECGAKNCLGEEILQSQSAYSTRPSKGSTSSDSDLSFKTKLLFLNQISCLTTEANQSLVISCCPSLSRTSLGNQCQTLL